MTRDQAVMIIAQKNHNPLIRYWDEETEIARRFIDNLIAIGVFIPDAQLPMSGRDKSTFEIVEADRPE